MTIWPLRETARLVAGGFSSWMQLRKNGDLDAKPPFYKDTETYQTMIWPNIFLENEKLVVEGIDIPLPRETARKIGDRKIAHVVLDRHESKLYLPSTWSVQCVTYCDAPMPQPTQRIIALDFGSAGVAGIDHRGKSFFIAMRRPDIYTPMIRVKTPDGTFVKTKGKSLRDEIATLDVQISLLRDTIKSFPKEIRQQKWRELELNPEYQKLKQARAKLYKTMQNRQRDYHRKLADTLVELGDLFFVGKPIIRSKNDKLADTTDKNVKKNWNVQNTGSLAECIRLFKWRCQRAGKIVIETPDIKVDEQVYKVRKVKQAREHLNAGFDLCDKKKNNLFAQAVQNQKEQFLKGYQLLLDNNQILTTEIEKTKLLFEKDMWSEDHIQAIKKILHKSDPAQYKNIRINAGQSK